MGETRVRVLGSGDAFGSGGRFQTCILVQNGATRFLIDCGATSLVAMKRQGIDPNSIDVVLLSHLHGDHFGGLPFLILDAQFARRTSPLVIAGPAGVEERIRAAMEILFPGSSATPQRFPLMFVELVADETWTAGDPRPAGTGLRVTPYAAIHASGAPAFALRTEIGGTVIAYSGDTEWTGSLVQAAADADLFLCEAYFFDKQVKFHLDYRTLQAHRHQLTCRRLMLTHMSADMLAHLAEVEVECAEDGLEIAL